MGNVGTRHKNDSFGEIKGFQLREEGGESVIMRDNKSMGGVVAENTNGFNEEKAQEDERKQECGEKTFKRGRRDGRMHHSCIITKMKITADLVFFLS